MIAPSWAASHTCPPSKKAEGALVLTARDGHSALRDSSVLLYPLVFFFSPGSLFLSPHHYVSFSLSFLLWPTDQILNCLTCSHLSEEEYEALSLQILTS